MTSFRKYYENREHYIKEIEDSNVSQDEKEDMQTRLIMGYWMGEEEFRVEEKEDERR